MNNLEYILTIILFASVYTVAAQFPGKEYVVEINRTSGAWTKTGPPIPGITYIGIDDRAYNENTGTFIFTGVTDKTVLYSINVLNDSITNDPEIGANIGEFHFDNRSNILYGLDYDNGDLTLISMNPVTGTVTKLGNSLPVVDAGHTTYDEISHTYFFSGPNNTLYSINTANGNIISNPGMAITSEQYISSFSFGKSSGVLYGLLQDGNNNFLITINPTTGATNAIGSGTAFGAAAPAFGAVIDEANQQYIYVYDSAGYNFVTTLDIATGSVVYHASLRSTPSTAYDNFVDLQYDNVKGKLYAIHWETALPLPRTTRQPMITNVTVDITDPNEGQVTVKWTAPVQPDSSLLRPPYSYVVLRSKNSPLFDGLNVANPGRLTDTTFADTHLNTESPNTFYYWVLAYAANGNLIDTSPIASSVHLGVTHISNGIQLTWNATVPWTNNSPQYPWQRIYRGTAEGATRIGELTLIDSVNLAPASPLIYVDVGQYNGTPLSSTQNYCYAVMTQGSYGDPFIRAPLRNFSEITCSLPMNYLPPCAPTIASSGIDCNTFTACPLNGQSEGTYSNTIKWNKASTGTNCSPAIIGYNVYASSADDQPFTLIAPAVIDTFYVQSNLPSFAKCYKVSALGQQGQESPMSDQFCFDNCPNYVLPNAFTPNGDKCNEVFSAYSLRNLGANGLTPCAQLDSSESSVWRINCARFVNAVSFKVYNRWGKEVYSYQSGEMNSIYIDWDGKDNTGKDLDTGNYYYVADVVFDVIDPGKRNKALKGWLAILR